MPNKQQKKDKWSVQFAYGDKKKPSLATTGFKKDVAKPAIPSTNIKIMNRPNKAVGTTWTINKRYKLDTKANNEKRAEKYQSNTERMQQQG
eukprot:1988627-Ditylum_brightwellii.AAC.1